MSVTDAVRATSSNRLGRLDSLTYPTSTDGYRIKLAYEYQYGELSRIKDYNDPNTVPWQLNAMDAAGRVLDETLGAGVRVVTGFNSVSGRMFSRSAGVGGGSGIQNLSYWWDVNDDLIRREDGNQSPPVYEYYYNDNLNHRRQDLGRCTESRLDRPNLPEDTRRESRPTDGGPRLALQGIREGTEPRKSTALRIRGTGSTGAQGRTAERT